MFKFYILFLILLFVFWNNTKVKGVLVSSSNVLFGIYLCSGLCSIVVMHSDNFRQALEFDYWIPMIEFLFTMLLFLSPFRVFNETKIEAIKLPNMRILHITAIVLIVLSFYAIFYFLPTVRNIFQMDLGSARNDLYAGESYIEAGIFNTIATVGASFYVFAQLFFFVFRAIGGHKWTCRLLLISSISEPIHVLSFVGRDGVVFWIFSFVFLYAFFKRFLSDKDRKNLRKSFFFLMLILLLPFIAITTSRFASSDSGTTSSLFSYMGMSYPLGILYFGLDNPPISIMKSFPFISELIGIEQGRSVGMLSIGDWYNWGFSTFTTGFYSNFGQIGMYVLAVFLFLFFIFTIGRGSKCFDFHRIFIYILYFQVFSQGVFYFRQYTRGGNLFIVLCPVLMMVFYILINTKYFILKIKE